MAPMAAAAPPKRRRGRPPKRPVGGETLGAGVSVRIDPIDGVWLAVAWMPDGSGVLAIGESTREPSDLWILPVPGPDATPARRPRRLTRSRPAAHSGNPSPFSGHCDQSTPPKTRKRPGAGCLK